MDLLCFQCKCWSTKRPVSNVNSIYGLLCAFGWHNISVIKLLQSDVFMSIDQHILISVTFYTVFHKKGPFLFFS